MFSTLNRLHGTWMFHCHVLHHATNDGVEPGGLVALVHVTE